jgi:branched-chain amino acid transport system substrate-binding protein
VTGLLAAACGGERSDTATEDDVPETDGEFALDVDACPDDWNPTQGVTDDEILLGASAPQSGPMAVLAFLTKGMQAYFDYANAELGGVDGRQIKLIAKDDAYEPNRTVTNITELVESDGVFGLVGNVGTPNNLAVWDDLNDQCIPHLFIFGGAPEWGDVAGHPWSLGGMLPYPTEAVIWADHIEKEFPDGAEVAVLAMNNDFGRSYEVGFEKAIEGTNIEVVETQRHDQSAPNLNNEVTTLAATDADVLLGMTTGDFCPQMLQSVAQTSWEPTTLISGTCAAPQTTFMPIAPAGDGTLVSTSLKTVEEDSDDPAIQFYLEKMAAHAPDVPQAIGIVTQGWVLGEAMYNSMLAALELEGGLTRSNVLLGARSLDYEPDLNWPGVMHRLDGAVDPFLVEASVLQAWNAETGTYDPVTDLIDYEGKTGEFLEVP